MSNQKRVVKVSINLTLMSYRIVGTTDRVVPSSSSTRHAIELTSYHTDVFMPRIEKMGHSDGIATL